MLLWWVFFSMIASMNFSWAHQICHCNPYFDHYIFPPSYKVNSLWEWKDQVVKLNIIVTRRIKKSLLSKRTKYYSNLLRSQGHHCWADLVILNMYKCMTIHCLHGPLTRYAKLRVAHAPGLPVTFSPTTAGQRSRHASRHVRDARAVMHAGIVK